MANIPDELILEILVRLPVKALVRFQCLSKALCREIDSESFTNAHRKLVFATKSSPNVYMADFDDEIVSDSTELENPLKHQGFGTLGDGIQFYGSCNGLVLLSCLINDELSERCLWLWNPCTRKLKKIPDFFLTENIGFGFGYDSFTNDYKVVQIECWIGQKNRAYSLASNRWRKIPVPYDFKATFRHVQSNAVFADGSLHWLSSRHIGPLDPKQNTIVTFDLFKEVFVNSAPPPPPPPSSDGSSCLQVLEGSLVFVQEFCSPNYLDLFSAVKSEEEHCSYYNWTKLFRLNLNLTFSTFKYYNGTNIVLLEQSNDGHKLLLVTPDSQFCWYDLKRTSSSSSSSSSSSMEPVLVRVKNLNSGGDNGYIDKAIFCWESLVSPGTDDHREDWTLWGYPQW